MTEGVVFLASYYEAIRGLPDAERLMMYDAIVQYGIEGELPELPPILNAAFLFCKPNIDSSKSRYFDSVENGKKGGRPRTKEKQEQEPTLPSAPEQKPVLKEEAEQSNVQNFEKAAFELQRPLQDFAKPPFHPQNQDKDKETDKDKDRETEMETDKEIEKESDVLSRTSPACRDESRRAIEAWNALGLTQVTRISPESTRYRLLTSRIREHGIDNVLTAIERIRTSDFLRGQNRNGWVITLDWFVKPNNFVKVLDGNFDNHKKAEGGGSGVDWIMNLEL